MHHGRNAQAGLFDQETLDCVGRGRAFGRLQVAGAADAGDLTDTVAHQVAGALRIGQLVDPGAAKLGDLLVKSHARQQVRDTGLNRLG